MFVSWGTKTFVDGYLPKTKGQGKIMIEEISPVAHICIMSCTSWCTVQYSTVQCCTLLYGTIRSAGKIPSRLVSDCRPPPRRTSPLCPIALDATRQLAVAGPAVVAVASTTYSCQRNFAVVVTSWAFSFYWKHGEALNCESTWDACMHS